MTTQNIGIKLLLQGAGQVVSGFKQAGSAATDFSSSVGRVNASLGAMPAALAGLLSGGALGAFVKGVADSVDALNDVADATGSTVEEISKLERVARQNGQSLDTVASALVKFNKALGEADGKNGTSLALQAIGLEATKLKQLDPSEALRQTAVALSGFADDGNKARIVQELFGKSLREVAPLLKDLASESREAASVTLRQAEEAEKFNKQLGFLKANLQDVSREVVGNFLPQLNDIIARFILATQVGDGFAQKLSLLFSVNRFTTVQEALAGVRAEIEKTQKQLRNVEGNAFLQGNAGEANRRKLQKELSGLSKKLEYLKKIQQMDALRNQDQNFDSRPGVRPVTNVLPDLEALRFAQESQKVADQINASLVKRVDIIKAELELGRPLTDGEKIILDTKEKITQSADKLLAKDKQRLEAQAQLTAGLVEEEAAKKRLLAQNAKIFQQLQEGADEIERAASDQSKLYAQNVIAAYDASVAAQQQAEAVELEASMLAATNVERVKAVETLKMMQRIEQERERLRRLNLDEGQRAELLAKFEATALVDRDTVIRQFEIGEFQRTFEQIGGALTQEIMRGGKSAGRLLKDYFKTLVLQPVIKAFVNPIAGAVTGALGLGSTAAQAAQGGSALGAAGNAASTLGGIAAMAKLAAGNFAGGVAAGFSSLTGGMAAFTGALDAATIAIGAGNFAGAAGTLVGALGPIALATGVVANALGLFRSERQVNSGLVGTLGSGSINDANVIRKGGTLFSGPEYRTEVGAVSQASRALQDAFNGLRMTTADQVKALGLSSEAVLTFTTRLGSDSINNDAGTVGISLEGLSPEQASQKIAEALAKAADEIAKFALGTTEFSRQGETATQTLARLSSSITTVNQVLAALGKTTYETSLAGASLASQLADAFGGLQAFTSATAGYFEAFYTEQERAAAGTRQLTEALRSIGVDTVPATRAAFRSLVDAQDLNTEAGRKAYATLIQLSGAFAELNPIIEQTAQEVEQVAQVLREDVLEALRGVSDELIAGGGISAEAFRQFEINQLIAGFAQLGLTLTESMIDGATATNTFAVALQAYEAGNFALAKAILQSVPTLQQVSTAWRTQTAEAQRLVRVAEQQSSLETRLLQLQGNTVELRKRELAALEPENRALLQQIFALEDAQAAADAARVAQEEYNRAVADAETALETAKRAVEAAQGNVDGIRDQATNNYISALERVDSIQQRIAEQARQVGIEYGRLADSLFGYLNEQIQAPSAQFGDALKKALAGDRDALSSLPGLASGAIDQARSGASTFMEAEIARAKILDSVRQAAVIADAKRAAEADEAKTLQQELLQAQKDQADALKVANTIGAALTRTQEDLVTKFKDAQDALNKALKDQAKAQAALDAIKTNTGNTSTGVVDAVKTLEKLRGDVIAELIKGFDGIDLNLDGVIDYEEFAKPFAGLATDARLKAIFEEIDANGDGVISKLETIRAGIVVDLPKKFDTLDTSLDTLLSIDEFKKGYAGLATDAELTKIFKELDTNGDSMLTKLEAISKNTATTATNTGTSLGTVTFNPSAALKSVFDAIREGTRLQLVQLLGTQNINNDLVVTGAFNTSFDGVYKLQFESRDYLKAISSNTASIVNHTLNTAAEIVKIANRTNKPQVVFDRGTAQGGSGGAVFATGGVFTNGIVTRPTMFDMGLMGERGSEAIMPLTNIGGSLGVRAVAPDNSELVEEVRLLRQSNDMMRAELRSIAVSSGRTADVLYGATDGGDDRFRVEMVTE